MASPNLIVKIAADSSKLVKELDNVSKELNSFSGKIGSIGTTFNAVIGSAAVGAVVALTKNSLAAGEELRNLTRVAGAGVIEFQKYAAASRTLGINQDKLADIFKDVNDKVGDFLQTGGGALKDFFENIAPQVGVTAQQFKNLSGPQALELYVKSLKEANLSQADMTFYMEAIASDATALLPLYAENGKLLREQGDAISNLLTSDDIQNLSNANTAIDNLTSSVKNLGTSFIADLAPYITTAANALTEFLKGADETEKSVARVTGQMSRRGKNRKKDAEEELTLEQQLDKAKETLENASNNRQRTAAKLRINELNEQIGLQKQAIENANKILGEDASSGLSESDPNKDRVSALLDSSKMTPEELAQDKLVRGSEAYLQNLAMGLLTEEEQLQASYERQQAMLEEHLAIVGASDEQHKAFTEALEQDHLNKMIQKDLWYKNESFKFDKLSNKQKYDTMRSAWNLIEGGASQHSKALHSITKAFAITDAILKAKESVVSAFAAGSKIGGPPVGFAFAGIAAAAQAANVAAMYNDSPSIGGGASAVSVPSAESLTPISEQPVEKAEETQIKTVRIEIEGDAELIPRSTMRAIAEQINELRESNVRLLI